ncbi:MAG: citrate/2-methylcitrate synthase, partial [Planctomycetota bacterium]
MPRTVKIELDGKAFETPGIVGTEGEKAFDISDLRAKTGYITLDPGYGNTGSCESKITFIDGEKGVLRYRGYPIEELAEKSTFVETAYLLIYGELPTKSQLQTFSSRLNEFSLIHEDMRHFFIAFPSRAHPMGILSTMVASLSVFYPVPDELTSTQEDRVMAGLISQVRTIAAFSYKKFVGEPVVYPSMRLRYVENLLNMLFSSPVKGFVPDPDVVRAIEVILILHADHEQNCSTSTVRMVASA